MRAAAVQLNSQDNVAKNVAAACSLIEQAAAQGADLVALPEYCNVLHDSTAHREAAEPVPGPTIERFAELARAHKIYVHCGSIPERTDDPQRIYNTTVLLDREGEIVGRYRKIHLFDVEIEGRVSAKESEAVMPGGEVVVLETEFGPVGLTICYDLRFPELYRRLAVQGARVIFTPAAFTLFTGKDHWEVLQRARAIENQVYVVAPAQIGLHEKGKACYGNSMIVDPWGTVLARCPDRVGYAIADIDFDYLDKVRREVPSLANRDEGVFSF